MICDVDEARRVEWVLLATKAQQTPQAGPWLARLCRPGTVVVVLQNGVDHVERVTPFADGAAVLPALVYVAVERVARGRVVHRRGRRVVLPAGPSARAFSELLGVPTPANQAMYALLGALAGPKAAAERAAGLGLPGSSG